MRVFIKVPVTSVDMDEMKEQMEGRYKVIEKVQRYGVIRTEAERMSIFDLPLQVILLVWLLRSHHKLDEKYLREYEHTLDYLWNQISVPRGRLAKWGTTRLLEWVDRERGRVQLLLSLGFVLVGKLRE